VTTVYKYDDFGKLNRIVSPDSGTWNYGRDEAGNLTTVFDASGTAVINYLNYDAINRPGLIEFPSDPSRNITLTYDAGSNGKGRLTGRRDPSGSCVFSHDAQGNLITEVKTVGGVQYTIGYEYNKNRSLTKITYPSGRVVNYDLDPSERAYQVRTNSTTLASSIAYVPFGGVTSLTYGNGLSLNQSYDNQYRVSSITAGSVVNLTYGYDANGNVASLEDKINPPPTGVYGLTGTYARQDGTNRLSSIDTVPTNFGYDSRGNITSENNRTYRYDSLNQLVEVKDNGVTIAEYTYNGAGQRIKKVVSGVTRVFHYDLQGHIIAESDSSGTVAEYIYLEDTLLAMIRQGNVYYFHNNNLGTPQVLTDASGNVVWKALYNPFGMTQITIQTVENPFRLPGQYYDAETGLHYNYFRYYHPKIGRYLTPDPIGLAGGINLWAYVAGNPVNRTDSLGLSDRQGAYCPGGEWSSCAAPAISAFFGGGFTVSRPTYTCKSNKKKCRATSICYGGGAILAAGIGAEAGGFTGAERGITNTYNPGDFQLYSSGVYFTAGPFSETHTGTSSNIGLSKSWGLGIAYVSCKNVLIICDE
jgi:RHS repeat-associated protein